MAVSISRLSQSPGSYLYKDRPFAWPLQSAWQSLFLRCRSVYGQMWHTCGIHTRVNHEALSYSMFGNGIAPGVVAGGNWNLLGPVWRQIEACEEWMIDARLEPYAALHFSERTLRHYANARGPEATHAYLANVYWLVPGALGGARPGDDHHG